MICVFTSFLASESSTEHESSPVSASSFGLSAYGSHRRARGSAEAQRGGTEGDRLSARSERKHMLSILEGSC